MPAWRPRAAVRERLLVAELLSARLHPVELSHIDAGRRKLLRDDKVDFELRLGHGSSRLRRQRQQHRWRDRKPAGRERHVTNKISSIRDIWHKGKSGDLNE